MTRGFLLSLSVALIVARLARVGGEQEGQDAPTDEGGGGLDEMNFNEDGLGSDDRVILFFMFLFFAYITALLGSLLAYISWQDDRILDLYLEEGLRVEGDVVSIEHIRGSGGGGQQRRGSGEVGCGEYGNPQKEYLVSVEYVQFLTESYPIRIRKDLRVLERELVHPNYPELDNRSQGREKTDGHKTATDGEHGGPGNVCATGTCASLEMDVPLDSITDCPQPIPEIEIGVTAGEDSFFKNLSFRHYGKKLDLLVLPNLHLSALPAQHVERRLSNQYRMYTVTVVAAATLIAVICFRLAAQFLLYDDVSPDEVIWGWVVYWLLVVLVVAQLPVIHWTLRSYIRQTLEREYFEVGELIKGGLDDSSLSTGSDSFFAYRRVESQPSFETRGQECEKDCEPTLNCHRGIMLVQKERS